MVKKNNPCTVKKVGMIKTLYVVQKIKEIRDLNREV